MLVALAALIQIAPSYPNHVVAHLNAMRAEQVQWPAAAALRSGHLQDVAIHPLAEPDQVLITGTPTGVRGAQNWLRTIDIGDSVATIQGYLYNTQGREIPLPSVRALAGQSFSVSDGDDHYIRGAFVPARVGYVRVVISVTPTPIYQANASVQVVTIPMGQRRTLYIGGDRLDLLVSSTQ